MTINITEDTRQQTGFRAWLQRVGHILVGAHPSINEIRAQRTAMFSATIALAVLVTNLIGVFATSQTQGINAPIFISLSGLAIAIFMAYILSRSRYYVWGSAVFTGALSLLGYALIISRGGSLETTLYVTLPLAFSIGAALMPVSGMAILVVGNLLFLGILPIIYPAVSGADVLSTLSGVLPVGIALILGTIFRNYIERQRIEELTTYSNELQDLSASLEQRVADATQDLALAAEVGQRVSLVQDPDTMLAEAAELIRDRFDLYYTQIYLTDSTGRTLDLRAGTGDAGRTLLQRSHRLAVDLASINGTAATERRAVIVEDSQTSHIHRANPLLPETRSEMAVPLIAGERVVGVIDLQSSQPGALSEENLPAFEALAGQLAVSIVNADLFDQAEQARQEIEGQAQRMTQQSWGDFLDAIERKEHIGYTYKENEVTPLPQPLSDESDEDALVVPIQVSNQSIGALQFEADRQWTEDDYALANTVSQQMAQQVESLRLLAQAEQYQAEANEAVRRMTREGWSAVQEQSIPAYVYDGQQVLPQPEVPAGGKESLVFDISVRDEPVGQFGVVGRDQLSERELTLVTEISQQLSGHIEGLRLQQQTEVALGETEALFNVTRIASSATDLQDIWDDALTYILDLTGYQCGLIGLYNDEISKLEFAAQRELPEALETKLRQKGLNNTLIDFAYQEGKVINIEDLKKNSPVDASDLIKLGLHTYFSVPLEVGGEAIGTLCCFGGVEQVLKESLEFLQITGQQIGVSIEKAMLFEQTQQQAEQESLINIISQQIQSTTSIDDALQVTIRELGRALDAKWTSVQLG